MKQLRLDFEGTAKQPAPEPILDPSFKEYKLSWRSENNPLLFKLRTKFRNNKANKQTKALVAACMAAAMMQETWVHVKVPFNFKWPKTFPRVTKKTTGGFFDTHRMSALAVLDWMHDKGWLPLNSKEVAWQRRKSDSLEKYLDNFDNYVDNLISGNDVSYNHFDDEVLYG